MVDMDIYNTAPAQPTALQQYWLRFGQPFQAAGDIDWSEGEEEEESQGQVGGLLSGVGGDKGDARQSMPVNVGSQQRTQGLLSGSRQRTPEEQSADAASMGAVKGMGLDAGLGAGWGMLNGGGIASALPGPGTISKLGGSIVDAQMGNRSQWANNARFMAPTILGAFTGPVGMIAGGLLGGTFGEALGDAFDARKTEQFLDSLEDTYGNVEGRRKGYAANDRAAPDIANSTWESLADKAKALAAKEYGVDMAARDRRQDRAFDKAARAQNIGVSSGYGGDIADRERAIAQEFARYTGRSENEGASHGGGSTGGVGHGSVGSDGKGGGYGGKGAGADRW